MGMQDRFDGPSGGTAADWAADEEGRRGGAIAAINASPAVTGRWRGVVYSGYGFRLVKLGQTPDRYESATAAQWAANALMATLPVTAGMWFDAIEEEEATD